MIGSANSKFLMVFATLLLLAGCRRSAFDAQKPGSLPEVETLDQISEQLSSMVITSDNVADGITAAEVTLTIRSQLNRPVQGVKLDLWVSGNANVIVPCTRSNQEGLSRCKVYSTHPEDKWIKAMGAITLTRQTQFLAPRPTRSSVAIVTAGDEQLLPSGHKVIATVGAFETPGELRDSSDVKRAHSSIQGSLVNE